MYARHPQLPNSLTHRLTPAGERPKGGKAARDRGQKAACGTGPETEERKLPVELAQRQRRESSLWNWSREKKRKEKAACGTGPETEKAACGTGPETGKKAACGTGPEKACGTGPETEERKQPVTSQKRGSSRCANLVIIFQRVRFASSSESEVQCCFSCVSTALTHGDQHCS